MTLTILNVAYPLAPVGPAAVGGAEQVLTQLDGGLVRAGHRSVVVACDGSIVEGTLVATPATVGGLGETARQKAWERHRRAVSEALERWPVDLVHMHGIDFHNYLPPPGPPVLVTLHLPPAWYPKEIFTLRRPRTYRHCVSRSQQAACPPDAALLPPIENGIPVGRLPLSVAKRSFVMALGRICPEKGFHIALDAARRAQRPMLLAGTAFPYPEHQRYFLEEITPRLDRQRRYIGPLGLVRKRRLLTAARCLLVPSLAPETSSLVAMEALSCGTPVVAFPVGALPEIVEHGRTGFLVENEREMAAAIEAASGLDADTCRHAAIQRFSLERMIERYITLYRRLAQGAEAADMQQEAYEQIA